MTTPADNTTSTAAVDAVSIGQSDKSSTQYVKWFRHSSPYINSHRGKTFVLMLPGSAMLDENFPNIIHDIALLNSLGVKLALVHGARPQIDARLAEEGITSQFMDGKRITEAGHISAVAQAIGQVGFEVEAALSTGLPNSPMHGSRIRVVSGNFVIAKPMGVLEGVDLQYSGKVRRVDHEWLQQSLAHGSIAMISPMGYSPTGELFNLCFAEVATEVAAALKADKLIAFSSSSGVYDGEGNLLRELGLTECAEQLQRLKEDQERSQSLQACYDACLRGVPRAQMISFKEDGALLQELFTRDGSGTLVHRDNYEFVRQATIDDVGGLLGLIEPLEQQGVLVRRSRELLESEINRFIVMEKDGAIIACSALYPYGDDHKVAELACVATHPGYRKGGRAAQVLEAIEKHARGMGIKELFVLTTQTAHWFMEQGFVPAPLEWLPEQKKNLYNYQRKSKVFVKKL